MRLKNFKYFYGLLFLVACHKDAELKPELLVDIFVIMGQSNTENGYLIDSSIDKISQGVLQLGRAGNDNFQLMPATDPLQHWDPRKDRNGFGLAFAKIYQDSCIESGRKVLLIPCGKGNTGFMDNQWNKGDVCYQDAVQRIKYVLDNFRGAKLKGILWQQGERDLLLLNTDYASSLNKFTNDILDEFKMYNLDYCLIAGGMVPYWVALNQNRIAAQKTIQNLSLNHTRTAFANPYLPFVIDKKDNNFDTIHYDSKGQRELAKRYFNAYKSL